MSSPRMLDIDLGEDLCDRLRDLAERYPKGLGLVKEFLQNADDAGATYLRVVYDRRQHPGKLPDSEMNVALGPALLFINDRPFTGDDIQRIHRISDSGKVTDAGRTGRFGQGFNTSYSVSDHPSLVTDDRIIWFDPHRRIQDKGRNSYPWALSDVAVTWPAWLATFSLAQVESDGHPFDGAAFRLPLRSPEEAARSRIRNGEPFLPEHFDAIVEEVQRAGPALLIFLRSVLTLELLEIDPSGHPLPRVLITTENAEEVEAARAELRAKVRGEPADLVESWLRSSEPLPAAQYKHTFLIACNKDPFVEHSWEVVTGVFRGPDNLLLKHALALSSRPGRREKAIPWAGAAAPVASQEPKGRLSCFLPLPDSTMYPVWLHGWFAVDSARRGLARINEVDELIQQRVQWNVMLMRHAVGPAWAQLLVQFRGAASTQSDPYEKFPNEPGQQDEIERALWEGFYAAASTLPLFRGRGKQHSWGKPDTLHWNIPATSYNQLEGPLRASGCVIAAPTLNAQVEKGLTRVKTPVRSLTPKALREHLENICKGLTVECPLADAPNPMLAQREWIIALARFCAQDGLDNLMGLPLALCSDGKLRRFDPARPIWIAGETQRSVLAPLPDRQLDPDLVTTVFKGQPAPKAGVHLIDTAGLLGIIKTVLSRGTPEVSWLEAAFELLGQTPPPQLEPHKETLRSFPLVPDQSGRYSTMGNIATPLLPGVAEPSLLTSLKRLGIPVVAGAPALLSAVTRFTNRHQNYIWSVTPTDVADMLARPAPGASPDWAALAGTGIRGPLLDLLSKRDWLSKTDKRLNSLRALPLLPTMDGELVAANAPHVYIPTGFTPPPGVGGRLKLLDLGEGGRWRPLAESLGIPALDGLRFVLDVLLPAMPGAAPDQQDRLLLWLRDELPLVERVLKDDERQKLIHALRHAALLPTNTGELCEPLRVYAPDAEEPDALLGPLARKPDLKRFARQWEMWIRFFERLQLPRQPLAHDLLERIEGLSILAAEEGVAVAAPTIHLIARHMGKRWKDLEGIRVRGQKTLARWLTELPWLPARRMDAVECAGARVPDEQLYVPRDLAQGSLRHLLASVSFVYFDGDLPAEMARDIGLKTEADPVEVLKHLDSIRNLRPSSHPKAAQALLRGFKEILKYLGALDDKETFLIQDEFDQRRDEPVILVRGQWWRPARVFAKRMGVPIPGTVSLPDDADLLKMIDDPQVFAGLQKLGVRESPAAEDWVEVLSHLAEEHANQPLPPGKLSLARTALAALGAAEADWLQAENPWVVTADACLARACDAFIPDDPRLKTLALVSPIPLVEEIEQILVVARRAGTPSLRASLTERLKGSVEESAQHEIIQWQRMHTRRFRSVAFHEALRRIAYDDAVTTGIDDPIEMAGKPALQAARHLQLRIASPLEVEVVLNGSTEVVIFDHQPASFLNESDRVLWLHAGKPRRMFDELVRAICRLCEIDDTLRVSRLLEVEPEHMHPLLDEEDVAVLTVGVPMPAPLTPSFEESEASQNIWPADEDMSQDMPVEEPEGAALSTTAPSARDGSDTDRPGLHIERSPLSHVFPTEGHRYEPLRPVDPDAPRPLGDGSSHVWGTAGNGPAGDGSFFGTRLRSYGHAHPKFDYDTGPVDGDPAAWIEVQRVATEHVRTWEEERGRPMQTASLDGAWELITGEGEQQRKIKVRGLNGPWTTQGVGLTRAQMEVAREQGTAWWLYVVEHVHDPQRVTVWPIPNPAVRMTEIRFDAEWRTLAESKSDEVGPPQIGDRVEREDGRSALVIEVEDAFAPLFEVTLRFEDGSTESCTWQPHWKRSP